MERCVARSTRLPERCCGKERYGSMIVIEEERRRTADDVEYRKESSMESSCDSVWGVWCSRHHVSRTGVPMIEEEVRNVSGSEWVSKPGRAIMYDLMAEPRKKEEIQDAKVVKGYSEA
tara:strand:- start:265 stop:618 length:354 start_codon:yes stop_codon:yes gene_type:complete